MKDKRPLESQFETDDLMLFTQVIQALIMTCSAPISAAQILRRLPKDWDLSLAHVKALLGRLQEQDPRSAWELMEVASGWRYQIKASVMPYLLEGQEEKPQRYSRAFMETLALIAYRQPVTRGEIEDVRGVSVSPHIMNTLLEHGWIKAVGHRDVPGRPTLYATTAHFLDYFQLKNLSDLPQLPMAQTIDMLEEASHELLSPLAEEEREEAHEEDADVSENEDTTEENEEASLLDPELLANLLAEEAPDKV